MLITSKNNPSLKTLQGLLSESRLRKKHQQTVLEGTHLLQNLLASHLTPVQVIISDSSHTYPEIAELLSALKDTPVLTVSDGLYKQLRTLGTSLPIMAIIDTPMPAIAPVTSDCLIIDGVQDTGNLGTLLRTAAATGFHKVLCTTTTASAWSPKTLRAGMAAHFSLTIYEQLDATSILTNVKVPLFATSSHAKDTIFAHDLRAPLALVMGNEGQGVQPALLTVATTIALPQLGQESLNVAVAGSICLYEVLRQRHYA